jgi:Flp pilus assembly pilin Flp
VIADIQVMKIFELPAREEGQTMAEYGTVLTVITLACLTAFVLLATSATNAYARVAGLFS